jgi:hypothetical protein
MVVVMGAVMIPVPEYTSMVVTYSSGLVSDTVILVTVPCSVPATETVVIDDVAYSGDVVVAALVD